MFWKLSGLDRNSFIIELKILIDFNGNELSWLDGVFDAKIGENTTERGSFWISFNIYSNSVLKI